MYSVRCTLLCNLTFSLLETAVFVINAKKDSLLSLAYLWSMEKIHRQLFEKNVSFYVT